MQKKVRREFPTTMRQLHFIHAVRLLILMACLLILWNTGAEAASRAGGSVDLFAEKIKVNTVQVLASPRKEDVIQAARILDRMIDGVYIKKIADQYILRIGSFPDSREGIQEGLSVLDEVRKVYPKSFLRPIYKTPPPVASQNARRDYRWSGGEQQRHRNFPPVYPDPMLDRERYGYGSVSDRRPVGDDRRSLYHAPERNLKYGTGQSYRPYGQGSPDFNENRFYESAPRSYGNKKAVAPELPEERPIYSRPLSRNLNDTTEDYFPSAGLGKEKEGQATISNLSPSSSPAEMSETDLMVARPLVSRRPESSSNKTDNSTVKGANVYDQPVDASELHKKIVENRERILKKTLSGERKSDDGYSTIKEYSASIKPKSSPPFPTPSYSAAASGAMPNPLVIAKVADSKAAKDVNKNDEGSLTLEESIKTALKQSVVIQSAKEGIVGAEYVKKEAFTNFLPKLSTSYNYTRLNEPPTLRTPETSISLTTYDRRLNSATAVTIPSLEIPMGTKDNYAWALEVKQPLFAGGGILSNYLANRTGEEIARMEEVTATQDVIQEVKVSYYNVLKAQSLYDVAVKSLERLKAHRDMAESHLKVGLVALNDYLATDVEVANGEQNLVKAENGIEMAKAKFNTTLRRPLNAPVELVDILEVRPINKTLEFCINEAMYNRPEIKTYSLKAKQAGHFVDAAKSEYFPTASFIGHYELSGDTPGVNGAEYSGTFASSSFLGNKGNVTVHGSQTKDRESWYLMFMVSWNFWEWGKTQNRVGRARSQEMQVNYALANIRDQISLEVKNAWLTMRQAEKQISVTRKAIDEAEESFLISLERYQESMVTTTTVLDAQTRLTKANSDYYNAIGDYQIGLAKLERAMGKILPENWTGE